MHGVVLLAAGSGKRMGSYGQDKILEPLGSNNAFRMCLLAFINIEEMDTLVIVYRDKNQREKLQKEVQQVNFSNDRMDVVFVQGGKERSDSVRKGLDKLPPSCKYAHIHDCARPMIRRETIKVLVLEVSQNKPIAVARQVTNTIRRKLSGKELLKTETLTRTGLWEMETPQSAPKAWLCAGYAKAKEMDIAITDDMHAIELLSKKIVLLDPGYPNPKITYSHDLKFISYLVNNE